MQIINAQETKMLLDKDQIVLVDVRTAAEHRSEFIKKSILIPLNELSANNLPTTAKPIVLHCQSGARSKTGCEKITNENQALTVYSLDGGIKAWTDAGFPTEKTTTSILPLDRQTQLTSGVLILSTIILGTFVNTGFYFATGLIGAGLIFAGLSGWCGMAKLIATMPWNK